MIAICVAIKSKKLTRKISKKSHKKKTHLSLNIQSISLSRVAPKTMGGLKEKNFKSSVLFKPMRAAQELSPAETEEKRIDCSNLRARGLLIGEFSPTYPR